MVQRLEFLSKVSPFNLLPTEVLEQVADQLQEIRYSKDTVIYQQEVTKMRGVDIIAEGEYESFFMTPSKISGCWSIIIRVTAMEVFRYCLTVNSLSVR
ncbi:hypothetical protein ACRQ5D_30605 [Mucilaginibacter sp. P25]|uniref:hypothetical protein n=1 Tax=Mucilaginibacter sp. P25 TaxID=3423945 RepID=UPI003D7BF52A